MDCGSLGFCIRISSIIEMKVFKCLWDGWVEHPIATCTVNSQKDTGLWRLCHKGNRRSGVNGAGTCAS